MVTIRRIGQMGIATALAVGMLVVPKANAFTSVDRPSAIVVFAKIVSDTVGTCVGGLNAGAACPTGTCDGGVCRRRDTVIELSNQNMQDLVAAHCFYVNANSHCSNTGETCTSSVQCQSNGYQGQCQEDCTELDFDVRITPNQPLVWSASEGLGGSDLPLRANAGTRVPPVPEQPFLGELRCVQVDPNDSDRHPAVCASPDCANDLLGRAIIESTDVGQGRQDAQDYSAIGFTALQNDGNGELAIGDPAGVAGLSNEYGACPMVLVLDHLFDGAIDPISGYSTASELTLVRCSEDMWTQGVTPVTAQFLVYNEFEQRFSTSRPVSCLLNSQLSRLDTTQPARSIFAAGVSGTLAGQTRVRGVNGGLLGVGALSLQKNTPEVPLSTGTTSFGGGYDLSQAAERLDAGAGDLYRIP